MGESINMTIVTNSEFDYQVNNYDYDKQNEIFNISYVEKYTEEGGIYFFTCNGEFTVNGVKVYAQYEGLSLEPQSNFINFMQQCITIK